MKKKFSLILAFILVFSWTGGNVALATSTQAISQEDMRYEIESILDEIELNIEENIKNIEENKNMDMEENIDESIRQNEALAESYRLETYNRSIFDNVYDRYIKITNLIERQYKLKKTFVENARYSYELAREIEGQILDLSRQLRYVLNNEEVQIPVEDFYNIMSELKVLNLELKNSNYRTGRLAKESLRYVRQVLRLDLQSAARTFENIVQEQYRQIELLENSLKPINSINNILSNI